MTGRPFTFVMRLLSFFGCCTIFFLILANLLQGLVVVCKPLWMNLSGAFQRYGVTFWHGKKLWLQVPGAMLWSAAMMGLLVLGIGVGGAIEDRWIWPRRYRVEKVISVMVIVLFTTIALLGFA
jgi:hypothetical protein